MSNTRDQFPRNTFTFFGTNFNYLLYSAGVVLYMRSAEEVEAHVLLLLLGLGLRLGGLGSGGRTTSSRGASGGGSLQYQWGRGSRKTGGLERTK